MPEGPDFEEGDEVEVIYGAHEGEFGVVRGYREETDEYAVQLVGEGIFRMFACRDIVLDEDDDLDDVDDILEDDTATEIHFGDRVIVVEGFYKGQAGKVAWYNPLFNVLHVQPDDEILSILVSPTFVVRSPYQDEVLEEVPSV